MLVAFSVTPLGAGDSVGDLVAEAVRVVRASGLPNRTDAMFTTDRGRVGRGHGRRQTGRRRRSARARRGSACRSRPTSAPGSPARWTPRSSTSNGGCESETAGHVGHRPHAAARRRGRGAGLEGRVHRGHRAAVAGHPELRRADRPGHLRRGVRDARGHRLHAGTVLRALRRAGARRPAPVRRAGRAAAGRARRARPTRRRSDVVQTLVTGNVPEVAAAKVAAFGLADVVRRGGRRLRHRRQRPGDPGAAQPGTGRGEVRRGVPRRSSSATPCTT